MKDNDKEIHPLAIILGCICILIAFMCFGGLLFGPSGVGGGIGLAALAGFAFTVYIVKHNIKINGV